MVDDLGYYDTGSADRTLEAVVNWGQKNRQVDVHISEGPFVDFAVSRNESIKYAESFKNITHVIVLDAGDEIVTILTKESLKQILVTNPDTPAFQVTRKWKHGNDFTVFNLPLLFKLRIGCAYKYPVHEYLDIPGFDDSRDKSLIDPRKFVVFQDRNLYGASSPARWKRDLKILQAEHDKHPFDPRIIFYLAQTHRCLGDIHNAARLYRQRYDIRSGFWEERFNSALCLGEIFHELYKDDKYLFNVLPWFMKALSLEVRVEPLIHICDYYIRTKRWELAYMFIHMACALQMTQSCLFVRVDEYEYLRWHKMGLVAFYVGQYEKGKDACEKAIKARNLQLDSFNLQFYINKLTQINTRKNSGSDIRKETPTIVEEFKTLSVTDEQNDDDDTEHRSKDD
jgi:hypothetical protein